MLGISALGIQVNGTLTDNPKEIASFSSNFYSELYKSNYCKESASLFFQSLKKTNLISRDEQSACDKNINMTDIMVLKALKISARMA